MKFHCISVRYQRNFAYFSIPTAMKSVTLENVTIEEIKRNINDGKKVALFNRRCRLMFTEKFQLKCKLRTSFAPRILNAFILALEQLKFSFQRTNISQCITLLKIV